MWLCYTTMFIVTSHLLVWLCTIQVCSCCDGTTVAAAAAVGAENEPDLDMGETETGDTVCQRRPREEATNTVVISCQCASPGSGSQTQQSRQWNAEGLRVNFVTFHWQGTFFTLVQVPLYTKLFITVSLLFFKPTSFDAKKEKTGPWWWRVECEMQSGHQITFYLHTVISCTLYYVPVGSAGLCDDIHYMLGHLFLCST